MKRTIVYIGADHAGFRLKQQLLAYLRQLKFRVVDLGAKKLIPGDDYPDYAFAVAREVGRGRGIGVLVCGSAQGVCIAANKVRRIRAVAAATVRDVKLSREHNDANVLCLSGWSTPLPRARQLLRAFLNTPFSGAPRHIRRIKKISKLEVR